MNTDQIRTLLGQLQADPELPNVWDELDELLGATEPASELQHLVRSAARGHRQRGESAPAARLLRHSARLAVAPEDRISVLWERVEVLRDELWDEAATIEALTELSELESEAAAAQQQLAEHRERLESAGDLARTYAEEASGASDDVYRSSMLMRTAEMLLRFSPKDVEEAILERLEQAVRLDATNAQAGRMLELLHRRSARWDDAARVLERLASRSADQSVRASAAVRLARLYRYRLTDNERAAVAYERLLKEQAGAAEAMEFLANLYSGEERWDELVALYERELKSKDLANPETLGDMLQIAMLHHRMRGRPEDAEPWFERIRKLAPSHEGMLGFFREHCARLGDEARWLEILRGAARGMNDGKDKAALVTELAELAEKQTNAQSAIEQYKVVLRQDPDNDTARDALKRLYQATQGFNPWIELLRQQLERTPTEDLARRLAILREVADVYRQYLHNDNSLVTVLHQIVQLDEKLDANDVGELRELVALYDKLGRHRELLTFQLKLAEVTPDTEEKSTLFRSAARRWLEQFSNFQNATEAYEALLTVLPEDEEAHERLNELYRKRRAWAPLYDLLGRELTRTSAASRLALLREMAQLAAERLHKPDEAVALYRQILELEPSASETLDSLEKLAERSKDWATLAFALERRADATEDPAARLAVLQKLGAVCADHLADSAASTRAWRRVLELSPGHARALRVLRDAYLASADIDGLVELYATQNDWDGLVEVLSNAADKASEASVKIELSYRAAQVLTERLNQPERAFRSYERILATDPSDGRAATALIPLYERDEKWARLPALYELLLSQADSDGERRRLLVTLCEVSGQRLLDRKGAVAHALRAFELFPSEPEIQELLESTSRAASSWDDFIAALTLRSGTLAAETPPTATAPEAELPSDVESLEPRKAKKKKKGRRVEQESSADLSAAVAQSAAAPAAGEERRAIELRLARILSGELGRHDEAIALYRALLERRPNDPAVVEVFEPMLARLEKLDERRWLLGHRVEHAPDESARIEALLAWARLEESQFQAPEQAIEVLRRLLAQSPAHGEALAELTRLLGMLGRSAELAEVLEHRHSLAEGTERVEFEISLAELYLGPLGRPEDALRSAVMALDAAGTEPRALSVVERLLDVDLVRQAAAEVLASRFAEGGEARREAQALSVLLATAEGRERRLELVARLATVHGVKLGSNGAALDVVLRALMEFPDELELWDRAEELATAAGRPSELAEALRGALSTPLAPALELALAERAARQHEERLGDPVGAAPYLERVLSLDPGNVTAFQRLKDILTAAERWGELESMYDRAIQLTTDPPRKVDMLVEVAMIAEEIIEDSRKAIRYYERILEQDECHGLSLEALDRLYTRHASHEPLAALLERRLELEGGEQSFEMRRRLARLLLEQLHRPDAAITHVEQLLEADPNDFESRGLAERLLGIGSFAARTALALERVYEQRDEMRDLVRVLAVRCDALAANATPEVELERRELMRRISVLRDERLHDDAGAFEVLASYVPLAPADHDARARLIEIGRRLGRLAEVQSVLCSAFDSAGPDLALAAEVGMQLAQLEEGVINDATAAETTLRKVIALEPDSASYALPAALALERVLSATGQSRPLAECFRLQIRLEVSGDRKRELYASLGRLCRDVLSDAPAAVVAFLGCLEEEPGDAAALEALDGLYQGQGAFAELERVLERRKDLATEPQARRELSVRRARVLSEQLVRREDAVVEWRALVDEHGPDQEALSALEALYVQLQSWRELADTLEQHLDVQSDVASLLDLLSRLGDVRRLHLADAAGAIEAYRRALDVDTTHEATRAALQQLLAPEQERTVRREVAELLHPIVAREGNADLLGEVLEIEVETTDDPPTRLDLLAEAVRVSEDLLQNPDKAFSYACRGLREALGHGELSDWLTRLDRLSALASKQAAHVELLREIVDEIFDGDVQLAVTLQIAAMARDALSDKELARQYFERALEQRPEDSRALGALEALHESTGDAPRLLDVLTRRLELAEDDATRKELMFRQARLLVSPLNEPKRASEVYERIVDLDFDPLAVSELEALCRKLERWTALVELLERRADRSGADRSGIFVAIARIFAGPLSDEQRALDELERSLDADRAHAETVAELERLLTEATTPETRSRAASLLEPVYLMRSDFRAVMRTLDARLEAEPSPEERRELLGRLAQIYEEQAEDYLAALETQGRLFHDDIADTSVMSELERLAKVANAERRLAEIYASELDALSSGDDANSAALAQRAGELFSGLSEREKALVYYRRALAFEPDSAPLFAAVDGLLEKLEQHAERVALYRASLDHRFEPSERISALHVIATLERERLARPDEAMSALREALEVDDSDTVTLEALSTAYRAGERWEDLAALLLRRAEQAGGGVEASVFRLELAQLLLAPLGRSGEALDQLEEILRDGSDSSRAVAKLEQLRADEALKSRVVDILLPHYQQVDDWQSLIRLNRDRYLLAESAGDKVAVLRETAELYETRGSEPSRARDALGVALQADPEDLEVRADFERLSELIGDWEGLASLYESLISANPELLSRRDYVATLARTFDQHLDDPRRALAHYWELHQLEPGELEVLEHLERLSTLLSDWGVQVSTLIAKADVLSGDDDRASCWRRVGEARRDMLEDVAGAVEAYERALELDEASAFTVDCLAELHEQLNNHRRLVELLVRRVELCDADDDELRFELLLKAAGLYETQLAEPSQAVDLLVQASALRPADTTVLGHLAKLYESQGAYNDLLENLRTQAGAAANQSERAELRRRTAEILCKQLSSPEEALEAYRQVLDDLPDDAAAIDAVFALGREQEDQRENVAAVLIPVLRAARQSARHIEALELRLSVETEPAVRAETLRAMAELAENELQQPERALEFFLKALAEMPSELALHEECERLAAKLAGWSRLADVLEERARSSFEPDLVESLSVRLGRIAEEQLGDALRSIAAYQRAVDQVGERPELLVALDRLYTGVADNSALLDILERRLQVEFDDAVCAELSYRSAVLQIQAFQRPELGLSSLRTTLERVPNHAGAVEQLEQLTDRKDLFEEIFELLEGVYRSQSRTDRLAELYSRRVAYAGSASERLEIRRSLARVLEDDAHDPAAALRVLVEGLSDDPSESSVLDELERLAALTGSWGVAAAALEAALDAARTLTPELARELYVRVAGWYRDRASDNAAAERCLLRALEWDAENEELLVALESLRRVPGRERELIEVLRRRAKLSMGDDLRTELFREARGLSGVLNDSALAETVVRELVKLDDVNLWALAELTELRRAASDSAETYALVVRRIELEVDGGLLRSLRFEAATLARTALGKPELAIALYQQLFEDDPLNVTVASALRELYAETGRHADAASLLERLSELADTPEQRANLRVELAILLDSHLKRSRDGVTLLEGILEELPGHAPAVLALSRIYEALGADAELAGLLERQIASAEQLSDLDAELALRVRLAEVQVGRLRDSAAALVTYRSILSKRPTHAVALAELARLYEAAGSFAELAEILETQLAQADASEVAALARRLGEVRERLSDGPAAARAFERALALAEDDGVLRARLHQLYEVQGDHERLIASVARSVDLTADTPEKVKLLRELAQLQRERLQDMTGAAESLERASALLPEDRELLLQLCDAYSASGRGQQAAEALERIVASYGGKRSKELGEIHRRLGDAYAAQGQTERARDELDKAFRIEPGNARVSLRLAQLSLSLGDAKRAQNLYSSLLIQLTKPDSGAGITKGEILGRRGEAFVALGEKDRAKQDFERALQAEPGLDWVRSALEALKG